MEEWEWCVNGVLRGWELCCGAEGWVSWWPGEGSFFLSLSVLATQEWSCLPDGSHWRSLLSGWWRVAPQGPQHCTVHVPNQGNDCLLALYTVDYYRFFFFFHIFSSQPKSSGWVLYIVYVLVDLSPITYSNCPVTCFIAFIRAAYCFGPFAGLKVGGIWHSEIILYFMLTRVFRQSHTFVCLPTVLIKNCSIVNVIQCFLFMCSIFLYLFLNASS